MDSLSTDNDHDNILHYAFESMTQMEGVQEEVILDNQLVLPMVGESQLSLVSTSGCNPVVKDDSQCVDMVLEEVVVTDTHHEQSEDMLMIMNIDMSPTPQPPPPPSSENNEKFEASCDGGVIAISAGSSNLSSAEDDVKTIEPAAAATQTNQFAARTQPTVSVPSSTALLLPIVKIVPTQVNSNKIVMKIQAKEPPDVSAVPVGTAIEEEEDGLVDEDDGDEEEKVIVSSNGKTGEQGEEGEDDPSEDKCKRVHREMKQLQKMVDSSKVLTDFMTTKGRKSRKSVGRPKKKASAVLPQPPQLDAHTESTKRQSTRRMFAEVGGGPALDTSTASATTTTTTADEMLNSSVDDGDEVSMDYHSDNETNESVASGCTDSLPARLSKVNSCNATETVVAAPKVGFFISLINWFHNNITIIVSSLSGRKRCLLLALSHGLCAAVLCQLRSFLPHAMLSHRSRSRLAVSRLCRRGCGD